MPRLKTLKPSLRMLDTRLIRPPANSRQATRALHTDSAEWRAIRQRILIRDNYTCRVCGRFGNEVDHKDGNDANQAEANLQTLCKSDHSAKTAREMLR